MKPRKSTSSLSKREKMRRKPFNRRNKRSTSLRLLYSSLSYSQGLTRLESGGTTGSNPNSNASWRVSLPSYARSITIDRSLRCGPGGGAACGLPVRRGLSWGKGEGHGRSSICGNHMNLGGPAATRLSDGLWSVFFNAPRAIGMNFDHGTVHRVRLELDSHYLFSLQMFEYPVEHTVLGPAVHACVDRVPSAKPGR